MEEQEIKKLLSEMSLKEKINQMLQLSANFYESSENRITGPRESLGLSEQDVNEAGSVLMAVGASKIIEMQKKNLEKQPHHIPQLFMADIIHGCRTIFPIPLAQGCTFNPDLVKLMAEVSAKEAARAGLHITFSPMLDLVRDPRWGRVMESTGEDPYLNSILAVATIEGYQGTELSAKDNIAACVKHFAGYGAPFGGREYNQVDISKRSLLEDYLPAYKAGIDAGAELVMTSFNTLGKIPMSVHKSMVSDLLRKNWGFSGVVISDWGAIRELIAHGVAENSEEAGFLSFDTGIDIDMVTDSYANNLESLVQKGKISTKKIDEAVYRILKLKNKLGLFENPFKDADETYDNSTEIELANRTIARKSAPESFVLFKNDGILPLSKQKKHDVRKIAFIGPYVDEKELCSAWAFFNNNTENVTLKEGILNKNLDINVSFEKGCDRLDFNEELIGMQRNHKNALSKEQLKDLETRAIVTAENSDIVVMALGEHYDYSGEAGSRTEIGIPEHQLELFRKVYDVNPNIVLVSFSGRPLDLREVSQKARAILHAWLPGTEGGNAIADVLFGDSYPSGKLSMSFPYNVGQIPVFYNELSTGRPFNERNRNQRFCSRYIDAPNQPLYPFGYGLSYGEFQYSKIKLNSCELNSKSEIVASVSVCNVGNYAGEEVVQLYLHDLVASVARPVKELKKFKKIYLEPGEAKEVRFLINENMLKFYNSDNFYKSESGSFEIFIGSDSRTTNVAEFSFVKKDK